jgi:hypothetical protein
MDKDNTDDREMDKDDDMDLDFEDDDVLETITMTAEDGSEVEFCVIDEAESDGQTYLLLIESESVDDDEAEAVIFKEIAQDNDEFVYEEIEDDAEYDKIAGIFSDRDDYDIDL